MSLDHLRKLSGQELSMLSMEPSDHSLLSKGIINAEELKDSLDGIFSDESTDWETKKTAIFDVLRKIDFPTYEVEKYAFWDIEKPYTRNLMCTDGMHYNLIVMCWNPDRESHAHNHPCQGCFVRTLRGCVRETRFTAHPETNELRKSGVGFLNEGQVAWINDSMGFHKIGNPNKDVGAITLHLYTPPFKTCTVWKSEGVGALNDVEEGKMGFFSVMGHRTPQLEGRPGKHAKVMEEIVEHYNARNDRIRNDCAHTEAKSA
jgi:cysteine dioxygenase